MLFVQPVQDQLYTLLQSFQQAIRMKSHTLGTIGDVRMYRGNKSDRSAVV
jgi:hypothetical protein